MLQSSSGCLIPARPRCTYSQCMPCTHLHDLWTNMCGLLLVGVARALGTVGHACATKCERCEKEGKAYVLVWECECVFEPHRTQGYGSFGKTTTCFSCFARGCCSLSYSSLSTWTSRCCCCIYALSSFPFCARLQALSSLLPPPFWHCDNEIASTATALRAINLRKCTQRFVNRIF